MDPPTRVIPSVEGSLEALPDPSDFAVEWSAISHSSQSLAVESLSDITSTDGTGQYYGLGPLHVLPCGGTSMMIPCCPCIRDCSCRCHPDRSPGAAGCLFPNPRLLDAEQLVSVSPPHSVGPFRTPLPTIAPSNLYISESSALALVVPSVEHPNTMAVSSPEVVPQAYHATAGTERRFGLSQPGDHVAFWRSDGADDGVQITDMLSREFSALADPDATVLGNHACQIMLQINWPGYKTWSKPLRTRVRRGCATVPATRSVIAHRVALRVQMFMNEAQPLDQVPARWAIGSSGIRLEQMILRRLVQMTQGGWQVEIAV
ncbi:hypothetical protein DENSPDRAFT_840882 [Dentipellis sp. KUC8613]|nr:hypothetical protein DENSPDRAFT_840882 [Dentipellis sp. KUC8613]